MYRRKLVQRVMGACAITVLAVVPLVTGCTVMASQDQVRKVEEAKMKAAESEADLSACKEKRAQLERDLAQQKQALAKLENDIKAVKKGLESWAGDGGAE